MYVVWIYGFTTKKNTSYYENGIFNKHINTEPLIKLLYVRMQIKNCFKRSLVFAFQLFSFYEISY